MPLYEYRCNECKRKFTVLVGVTATREKRVCPHCGSRKMTKLISRVSPIARGDDFDDDLGDADSELDEDYGDDYDEDLED